MHVCHGNTLTRNEQSFNKWRGKKDVNVQAFQVHLPLFSKRGQALHSVPRLCNVRFAFRGSARCKRSHCTAVAGEDPSDPRPCFLSAKQSPPYGGLGAWTLGGFRHCRHPASPGKSWSLSERVARPLIPVSDQSPANQQSAAPQAEVKFCKLLTPPRNPPQLCNVQRDPPHHPSGWPPRKNSCKSGMPAIGIHQPMNLTPGEGRPDSSPCVFHTLTAARVASYAYTKTAVPAKPECGIALPT